MDSILAGLNNLRATAEPYPAGAPRGVPLQMSGALTRAAQQHVNRLVAERTLQHYPDLADLVSDWGELGENIAYASTGQSQAREA
jgi:uncharacterized protein YkwD